MYTIGSSAHSTEIWMLIIRVGGLGAYPHWCGREYVLLQGTPNVEQKSYPLLRSLE